jgi:hypothetical protein
MGQWFTFTQRKKLSMSRSVIALLCARTPEALSLRDFVLRRLLQAGLMGIVFLASFLTGTIISSIFFHGIEL